MNITGQSIINAMTVDVEDYFHVTAFAHSIAQRDWAQLEYRVEHNMARVLELFAQTNIKATFFVLGWVAQRSPNLVKALHAAGHEIACHGMNHELVYLQTPTIFQAETHKAKQQLEDLIGAPVRGYRAASYSITNRSLWALDILAQLGFSYDSSIAPIRHDIYGLPTAPRKPFMTGAGQLLEIPFSTVEVLGYRLPCSGGGYFRLLPYRFFKWAIQRVHQRDQWPVMFYFHPWEIDTTQPRLRAGLKSRYRHYTNLHRTEPRLQRLLNDFKWDRMDRVFLPSKHDLTPETIQLSATTAYLATD